MKQKIYRPPEMEITEFEAEDVIAQSITPGVPNDAETPLEDISWG